MILHCTDTVLVLASLLYNYAFMLYVLYTKFVFCVLYIQFNCVMYSTENVVQTCPVQYDLEKLSHSSGQFAGDRESLSPVSLLGTGQKTSLHSNVIL